MKSALLAYRRFLLIFTTCATVVFIFAHSLTPAALSGAESQGVYAFLFRLLGEPAFLTHGLVRKMAHFAEYALLGLHGPLYAVLWRRGWVTACFLGGSTPILDEGIQLFVSGRNAAWLDVLLDMGGFLFGVLVMLLLLGILKRKERIHHEK